jgi:ABC-2 type transport system permease protein
MGWNKLLPNKTLLWKESKNSWVMAAAFFGYITFGASFKLIKEILTYLDWQRINNHQMADTFYGMYDIARLLSFNEASAGFGSVLITIMLAATMLGRERDLNSFNFLLAMPYSRREIIYNKFMYGWTQIAAIFGLNALIMTLLLWTVPGIEFPFHAADIWAWALRNILVLGFVFSFTMAISSISGTTFGNGLLAMIFLYFPLGLSLLIMFNLDYWNIMFRHALFLNTDIVLLLTVPTYIMQDDVLLEQNLPLVYGVLLVLTGGLYQLTQYLFNKNHLEKNGEVLVFEQFEWFFKLGTALCFTLLGGPLAMRLFFPHSGHTGAAPGVIIYLLLAVSFWFAVHYLIKWRKTV